jgi:hypothetical protein
VLPDAELEINIAQELKLRIIDALQELCRQPSDEVLRAHCLSLLQCARHEVVIVMAG